MLKHIVDPQKKNIILMLKRSNTIPFLHSFALSSNELGGMKQLKSVCIVNCISRDNFFFGLFFSIPVQI